MYLDTWMRDAAGLAVGDRVRVRLRRDAGSRELTIPAALDKQLRANPAARRTWEQLAPSRRRESLSYLNFLKPPAALDSRIRGTIEMLLSP